MASSTAAPSQQQVIAGLPPHLRPFASVQDYSCYTARDQAVWRFLLHQLRQSLGDSAHRVYLEGPARTGIDPDHIPRIEEMNRCLQDVGWQAVAVAQLSTRRALAAPLVASLRRLAESDDERACLINSGLRRLGL